MLEPDSPTARGCLDPDEVLDFSEGRLDEAARRNIERHIDSCEACRGLLSELAKQTRGEPAPIALRGGVGPGIHVGRYEIVETLGQGGMGVVYRAYDPELGRAVAIKLVRTPIASQQVRARLLREAQSMARVTSPGVVAVYDAGSFENQIFLAMELIEGPTLDAWLQTPRSLEQILEQFSAAGRGLEAAHAVGLVHRDFKPQNVLVGADGKARVTDFGLAKAIASSDDPLSSPAHDDDDASDPRLTATGVALGTPRYMSPEQFDARPIDARSDQFNFCVALYEAVYAEWPFAGRTLGEVSKAVRAGQVRPAPAQTRVPGWLRRVLLKGLRVDPAQRFESIGALLEALAAASSQAAARQQTNRVRRRALGLGVLGAAVIALASLLPAWRGVEARAGGLLLVARPSPWPDRVLFADVDQATIGKLGWPLPRALYARLIDGLRAAGAEMILVDGFFTAPGVDGPEGDRALALALAGGRAVLAAPCTGDPAAPPMSTAILGSTLAPGPTPAFACPKVLMPLEPLARSVGLAQVEVASTPWGHVQGTYLLAEVQGRRLPTLALAAWAAGRPIVQLPAGLKVGEAFVPVEPDGATITRFRRPWEDSLIPVGTLAAGLTGAQLPAELAARIKGRFVIIGQSAETIHDLGAFASGERLPLMLLHGMQLADLIEDVPVRRVPLPWQAALTLLFGAWVAFCAVVLRPWLAALATAICLLGICGGALLGIERGWLLGPVAPMVACLAGAAVGLVVTRLR